MEEIKDMRNELEQQRNLNTKNKQKMEHKFFVEKMKMENEVKMQDKPINYCGESDQFVVHLQIKIRIFFDTKLRFALLASLRLSCSQF